MAVYNVGTGYGGAGVTDVGNAVKELQRLKFSPVAGAAAGTKMNVAALRVGDTLIAVLQGTSGTYVDDTANCTIQDTHASGTLTIASAADSNACVVDGVTFTFKTTPTLPNHVRIGTGGAADTDSATNLKNTINSYFRRVVGDRPQSGGNVVATSNAAVVTITARADGTAGNSIVLTGGTHITASGSGTLAGGTATGGIKSTTDNSSKQMLVVWLDHT